MTYKLVPLGDLVSLKAGFGFPIELQGRANGDYPFAKVGDISKCGRSNNRVLARADHFVDAEDLERLRAKPVPKGSVLFAKIGEAIRQNHRVIAGCEMLIDNNAMAAIPNEKIDGRFLFHFLRTVDFYALAPATTVPALRKSDLEKLLTPCPPLPEQRRIAAILDQADALRAKRREALAQLDSLAQSIFIEMFGDPVSTGLDETHVPFEYVTDRITYGFTSPMKHIDSGIPILTAKNVKHGFLDLENVHYADKREFDELTAKSKPKKGDILVTKDGTIGRTAVVNTDEKICINQSVALIQINHKKVIPEYVAGYLCTDAVQDIMKNMSKGNSLAHLQITELAKLPFPLPPIEKQIQFNNRVCQLKMLRAVQQVSADELDGLFASIQHRAFNGKL